MAAETFPFKALEYFCQTRFVELLDKKTLISFSQASSENMAVVKRSGRVVISKLIFMSAEFLALRKKPTFPKVHYKDIPNLPIAYIEYTDFGTLTLRTVERMPKWNDPVELSVSVSSIDFDALLPLLNLNISSLMFRGSCILKLEHIDAILDRLTELKKADVTLEGCLFDEIYRRHVFEAAKQYYKLDVTMHQANVCIRTKEGGWY